MLDELDLHGSEAEHRQPEDHRIIEDDLVLPEGVIHRVDPSCVLCACDLHGHPQLLPPDIQVHPPGPGSTDVLTGRLR